ncbi:MAG: ABC transporter substrate-binding protein [Rhodomicrobium sp.]
MTDKITAGFIPLVDAAALLVAADFGFAGEEGLEIELVREVSWANIREKLSAGLFDVAHMLAPMAIASSLDLMPGSVPLTAPFVLATNGNAITVSRPLYHSIMMRLEGRTVTPLSTSEALSWIIAGRKHIGKTPLTFGTTFPFSCHTYQLRFWMAAGGIDTAEDVRVVVLPPSYMAESLKSGEVDGFCVGAPWSSVAAGQGLGHILHYGCEIVERLTEKVLAARTDWAARHERTMIRLMRAVSAAAAFANQAENWDACCERLSAPDRIGAGCDAIREALSGALRVDPEGATRADSRYLILGAGGWGRPDEGQAAWLYSQMVRWGQAHPGRTEAAQAVFSPDLFDRAFGPTA